LIFFVFISHSKTTHIASFLFFDRCFIHWFSAAEAPKISPQALTVASLDNPLVLHERCNCRPSVYIVVSCIARKADRNGVKQ